MKTQRPVLNPLLVRTPRKLKKKLKGKRAKYNKSTIRSYLGTTYGAEKFIIEKQKND